MKFGAFLAPHHPIGESPTLLFRRDLALATHLDELGLDELWCGEHHSSGWETIASPELFLAAAGERTERIRLGTGVVSLPYHHPFNVAQRIVQLDHLTRGRVLFGTGPGALPSDAHVHGIEVRQLRDRQDEALGVILRLLAGEERFSHHSDWFELHEAELQILPLQAKLPVTVASSVSPSGMTLAGKYGVGVLSVASTASEGIHALSTQWRFAEESAATHNTSVDRGEWRVVLAWHLAESRDEARREVSSGMLRWHNEYNGGILGRGKPADDPFDLVDRAASGVARSAVIGTPDDLVTFVRNLQEVTGGFGVLLGSAHDWAGREATARSWELFARHVIPELNGQLRPLRKSYDYLYAHKEAFIGAHTAAVMEKISAHEGAAAAFQIEKDQREARHAAATTTGTAG